MKPWLDIVGIGEDGVEGLSPKARDVIEHADIIIGGNRHHTLLPDLKAERLSWPSPFDAMIDTIKAQKSRRAVVLVTGDPLWYSVGARILKSIPASEITFHPQLSAFQLATARMGWSLADVETLTVHGRPVEQVIPFFANGARLVILTQNEETPAQIARLLCEHGFGESQITVLAAMGGTRETRISGIAKNWDEEVPTFHTLCVQCVQERGVRVLPSTPGLPDEAFESDGRMTKREVRAITLSALVPQRGAMLWDIGCGCGSVAVEWLRAVRDAEAIGIEPRSDRRKLTMTNAKRLGVPRLRLVEGTAPDALAGLPAPDAVFIGGGLSMDTVAACLAALKPGGRLVVNAVTTESESMLISLHAQYSGTLRRISISRVGPMGSFHAWRPLMPVTQWCLIR